MILPPRCKKVLDVCKSWLDPSAMPPWDEERVLEKAVTDMAYEKRP